MGKDGDSDDLESGLNPELEAQIVALIHGELSGDALKAVEAEIAKDPAARVYRERILSVHELLGESSFGAEDTEWTLAPERKEQLLETLSGEVSPALQQDMINLKDLREKRTQVAGRRAMWSLAACFCFTLVLVTLLTEPWIALEKQNSAETATDTAGSLVDSGRQAPDTPKLLLQSEPVAEAAQFIEDFDAFGAEIASSPPEARETPEAAVRQRAFQKPRSAKSKVATESPKALTGEKVEDALSALDEEPVSPPAVTQRSAVDPKALNNSAPSEPSPFAASQAAAISEAVESSDEAGLEPQTDEAESFTEPAEEEAGGGEKRREVAFLGLGVFLGLLLGALFGLGLGRTWQRRAHSSH